MELRKRKKTMYEVIYEELKNDILSGKYRKNSRLPAKRTISGERGVSLVTVENAIAQLIAEGYVTAVPRSGYYVQYSGRGAITAPDTLISEYRKEEAELQPAGAGSLFPFSVWAKLMRTVILEQGTRLLRPLRQGGVFELRAAIFEYLYRCRGIAVSPEQIIIGAGAEYLYNLLIQLLGRDLCYAVENPCYDITERIYRLNGVKTKRVMLDEKGMSVNALYESGAEVAHISPAHNFPTGIIMPITRRREIMDWAEAAEGRYIIEDDYDSELRRSGIPVPTMFGMDRSRRVIYTNTFSQTLAPSVRISYMCLPPELLSRWKEKLGFYACPVPGFEQFTLAKFISEGYFERHISRIQKYAKRTAELTVRAVSGKGVRVFSSDAGLHFTITADGGAERIMERLKGTGVRISPIGNYFGDTEGAAENLVSGYENRFVVNYASADADKLAEIVGKQP